VTWLVSTYLDAYAHTGVPDPSALILVGDVDQLPSVPAKVLVDIIGSDVSSARCAI
jgi:hypothetical protein